MHTNRYYTEIKRITRSVAADPHALNFELSWDDFSYLRAMMVNYLTAKQTTMPLTTSETQFLRNAEVNNTDQSMILENCYVDPTLNQINLLMTLQEEETKEYQCARPHTPADFDEWMALYRQRQSQLEAFGSTLDSADLEKFTVFPHAGWQPLSIDYLETILTGYNQVQPLTTDQMTQIFGSTLVESYWPIGHDCLTFFSHLMATGLWLPNLITLLQEAHDPEINHLVILWLQWFKHDKTFHGIEVVEDAQVTIRKVKQIIRLLQQQRYDSAAPLLLKELPGLWE